MDIDIDPRQCGNQAVIVTEKKEAMILVTPPLSPSAHRSSAQADAPWSRVCSGHGLIQFHCWDTDALQYRSSWDSSILPLPSSSFEITPPTNPSFSWLCILMKKSVIIHINALRPRCCSLSHSNNSVPEMFDSSRMKSHPSKRTNVLWMLEPVLWSCHRCNDMCWGGTFGRIRGFIYLFFAAGIAFPATRLVSEKGNVTEGSRQGHWWITMAMEMICCYGERQKTSSQWATHFLRKRKLRGMNQWSNKLISSKMCNGKKK